jgi:hypothetical protein
MRAGTTAAAAVSQRSTSMFLLVISRFMLADEGATAGAESRLSPV